MSCWLRARAPRRLPLVPLLLCPDLYDGRSYSQLQLRTQLGLQEMAVPWHTLSGIKKNKTKPKTQPFTGVCMRSVIFNICTYMYKYITFTAVHGWTCQCASRRQRTTCRNHFSPPRGPRVLTQVIRLWKLPLHTEPSHWPRLYISYLKCLD